MLGFIQNHEDLSQTRLLAKQGDVLVPELDYASEMAGIVGATTNNSRGMAGIDRAARLQSYSLLSHQRTNDEAEKPVSFELPDGASATYYLDLRRLSSMLDRGRSNGIDVHLFSFGVPQGEAAFYSLPAPPDKRPGTFPDPDDTVDPDNFPSQKKSFFGEVQESLSRIFGGLCGDFGQPLSWLIGSCYSPPDPLENFRSSIGNAVAQGNGVVVAPAGDLNDAGQQPTPHLPGAMDKYALTVGGVKLNANRELVKWDRTREAPYVDVAGYAEDVVGLSGSGASKYNEDFSGTAAAASIGAGVAGLLKAENPSLSGEDVEEVLKRTARDADRVGRDDATGYGAIDAEAALDFVRTNDVQRATRRAAKTYRPRSTGNRIILKGYDDFIPDNCYLFDSQVWGERYVFRARGKLRRAVRGGAAGMASLGRQRRHQRPPQGEQRLLLRLLRPLRQGPPGDLRRRDGLRVRGVVLAGRVLRQHWPRVRGEEELAHVAGQF